MKQAELNRDTVHRIQLSSVSEVEIIYDSVDICPGRLKMSYINCNQVESSFDYVDS